MREMSVTEQRYKAVLAVIADGRTVSAVARDVVWPGLRNAPSATEWSSHEPAALDAVPCRRDRLAVRESNLQPTGRRPDIDVGVPACAEGKHPVRNSRQMSSV